MGPRGLVLRNPQPCAYVPAVGQLGYFAWAPADPPSEPEPAQWMVAKAEPALGPPGPLQTDLFGAP